MSIYKTYYFSLMWMFSLIESMKCMVWHIHMKREKRSKCLTYQAKLLLRARTESSRVPASWDMKV